MRRIISALFSCRTPTTSPRRSVASRASWSTTASATRSDSTDTDTGLLEGARTMKPIQVGLLGIGTVGCGTFNVLQRNQEEIRRRAGRGIRITMVADLDTARAKTIVGDAAQV